MPGPPWIARRPRQRAIARGAVLAVCAPRRPKAAGLRRHGARHFYPRACQFVVLGVALLGPATRRVASAEPPPEEGKPIDVTVRAPPRHPSAASKDATVAASVVRGDELSAPGAGLADALRFTAGVQITDTGGLGSPATASIRGATAAQTPVYLGGVRINDDVGGAVDLATVPPWLLDRVEIYRGHAPAAADRLSIGGAVFLEPVRPRARGVGAGAMLGSYGSRAGFAYASLTAGPHQALVAVRAEAADNDYTFADDRGTHFNAADDREGRRSNIDVHVLDVWALGESRAGEGSLRYLVHHIEREQGVPKLALLPSRAARADFARTLAAVTGRAPIGEGAVVEAQTSAVIARTTLHDPLAEISLGAPRVDARGERVTQRLSLAAEAFGALALSPSIDASIERVRRTDEASSGAPASPTIKPLRASIRAALAARAPLVRPLFWQALLAVECHGTAAGAASLGCDELQPTGHAGLSLEIGGLTVYSSAGRYVRVPTMGELYGVSVVMRGNPRLTPERALAVEAGARYVTPLPGERRPLWAEIALFSRWESDLIGFVRTAQGYLLPSNIASARVAGLELDAGAGLVQGVAARLSITALDPRDTTEDETPHDVLPFHARLMIAPGLEAQWKIPGGAILDRIEASARFLYRAGHYADRAGLAVIRDQASLDAELRATGLHGHATARVRVANVLNSDRFDLVGFPLPGRSVFASLEATW